MNGIKKYSILIFTILALILEFMGINYILILLLVGFLVAYITRQIKQGIITAVLYTILGFIVTYPGSLYITQYLPTTAAPVDTSIYAVGSNLLIGIAIPTIIAVIVSAFASILAVELVNIVHKEDKNKDKNRNQNKKHRKINLREKRQRNKQIKRRKREIIHSTPIQKIKDNQNKNNKK